MDTPDGSVRITDFMPVRDEAADLVRIVEGLSGSVPMYGELCLRFDYGRIVPWVWHNDHGLSAIAGPDAAYLTTAAPLKAATCAPSASSPSGPANACRLSCAGRPVTGRAGTDRPRTRADVHRGVLAAMDRPQRNGRKFKEAVERPASPSRPSPTPPPAASWPPPRPPCPKTRVAPELGLPLLLAPRRDSRCSPCSPAATPRRPPRGANGCCVPSQATLPTCRSCTGSTAPGACPRSNCPGCPAMKAPGRPHRQRGRPAVAAGRLG